MVTQVNGRISYSIPLKAWLVLAKEIEIVQARELKSTIDKVKRACFNIVNG